jgi:hypothetical protein
MTFGRLRRQLKGWPVVESGSLLKTFRPASDPSGGRRIHVNGIDSHAILYDAAKLVGSGDDLCVIGV